MRARIGGGMRLGVELRKFAVAAEHGIDQACGAGRRFLRR